MAQAMSPPALTAVYGPPGKTVWVRIAGLTAPQHSTSPAAVSAQLCRLPALTATAKS